MGKSGVGMPASLKLQAFGEYVNAAFDVSACYQVGSSLTTTAWRDVDVRVMLSDEEYERQGFGHVDHPHSNVKWVALTLAFSALGREMTGLPIDFQIQQQSEANKKHEGGRSALFVVREYPAASPSPSPENQT